MNSGFIVKEVYYNNKSRKGIYNRTSYYDVFGKRHTSIVKKDSLSKTEFINYINTTRNVKDPKQRKKYLRGLKQKVIRNKIKEDELRKESDKIKKLEDKEKKGIEKNIIGGESSKNWDYFREQSKNTLMKDNKNPTKKSNEMYEAQELAIILKIGRKSELSNMSEEKFRRKLYEYVPSRSPSQEMFLNDIVNKWGSEFKS